MSNRRNFIAVMIGTASLGVLSNLGKNVINPSYAQQSCSIDSGETGETARAALAALVAIVEALSGGISAIASAGASEILSASKGLERFTDAKIALSGPSVAKEIAIASASQRIERATNQRIDLWGKSGAIPFIKSAASGPIKQTAQGLKGKFTDKQIAGSVDKVLAAVKANRISDIESDQVIGPIVKAGYAGVIKNLNQASDLQRQIKALRRDLRGKMVTLVEAEVVKLNKESKLTKRDIQALSARFPALGASLRKFDVRSPGTGIQVPTRLKEQQFKSNATPTEMIGDAVINTSTSDQNIFDTYAQIFESRLLAVPTPINGEGDLTLVDRLLGIEKANACEFFCIAIILAVVAVIAIVAVASTVGIVAVSEAQKNEACKEATLKERQAQAVADCEGRAATRRRERLAARNTSVSDCGDFKLICAVGVHLLGDDIEGDFERDVDACS